MCHSDRVLNVGLTGGIAAGKSIVARRLAALGAYLIDADVLAREVVAPGTPGLAAVRERFGDAVIAADGSLDRPAIGRIVFADEANRRALEGIIHPLVAQRRAELTAHAPAEAIVVADIPLLVENAYGAQFQLVVVVHADAEERIRRLVDDRGLSEGDARARIAAQASDDERRAAADVWLDNDGTVAELETAVDRLWEKRLVPFESNVRHDRQAPRDPHAVLVAPDPSWPAQAERVLERVRCVAGDRALRVDHIGSTAVPGLLAKDVIDVQVVVPDLSVAGSVADDLTEAGLVRRRDGRWYDNAVDGTTHDKAFAQNADPGRAVNCHIRPDGSPAWREVLLLRDYLRALPATAAEYGRLKQDLASRPHDTIDAYADSKSPWIRATLAKAAAWAGELG